MIPVMNKPNGFLPPVEEELLKGIHDIQPLDRRGTLTSEVWGPIQSSCRHHLCGEEVRSDGHSVI